MPAFEIIHQEVLVGKLTCSDRLIFKGHLTRFYPKCGMKGFLDGQGVLLKDFGRYARALSEKLKAHADIGPLRRLQVLFGYGVQAGVAFASVGDRPAVPVEHRHHDYCAVYWQPVGCRRVYSDKMTVRPAGDQLPPVCGGGSGPGQAGPGRPPQRSTARGSGAVLLRPAYWLRPAGLPFARQVSSGPARHSASSRWRAGSDTEHPGYAGKSGDRAVK